MWQKRCPHITHDDARTIGRQSVLRRTFFHSKIHINLLAARVFSHSAEHLGSYSEPKSFSISSEGQDTRRRCPVLGCSRTFERHLNHETCHHSKTAVDGRTAMTSGSGTWMNGDLYRSCRRQQSMKTPPLLPHQSAKCHPSSQHSRVATFPLHRMEDKGSTG